MQDDSGFLSRLEIFVDVTTSRISWLTIIHKEAIIYIIIFIKLFKLKNKNLITQHGNKSSEFIIQIHDNVTVGWSST